MSTTLTTKNVTVDGINYEVEIGYTPWTNWREANRLERFFVAGEPEPSLERPPYGIKGENLDNDAAWRRYNREEVRIMRKYLAAAGIEVQGLRFSRKAGCSLCECSPGFVGGKRNGATTSVLFRRVEALVSA